MADDVKKNDSARRQISDKDRFRYIGFEVFPGKPKDLFKSDAEKQKLIDARREKKKKGEIIREECILFEERVSTFDRIILAIASVVMVASLFVPWFSAYNEIEETVKAPAQTAPADTLAASGTMAPADSLALMAGDTAMMAATGATGAAAAAESTAAVPAATTPPTEANATPAAAAEEAPAQQGTTEKVSESEEIIHSYVAHKRYRKEYTRLSGIGVFGALGSVGGVAFSSGVIILLSTVLMILYILLCIALPVLTLYGLFGTKGDADARALQLKKIMRLNWLPLILFAAVLFLSFFGGSYSQPVGESFGSLGSDYSVGVFLDMLSYGVIISLAASILVAAKGSEI